MSVPLYLSEFSPNAENADQNNSEYEHLLRSVVNANTQDLDTPYMFLEEFQKLYRS